MFIKHQQWTLREGLKIQVYTLFEVWLDISSFLLYLQFLFHEITAGTVIIHITPILY